MILLGFYFFGLQIQFEVPAMLSKKTGLLVPGSIVGVIINVAMNFLLIPSLGSWGAGWPVCSPIWHIQSLCCCFVVRFDESTTRGFQAVSFYLVCAALIWR